MQFDLNHRTAALSVGDFADFTLGPRDGGGGTQGLWRAQLGTHWHQQLRAQTASEQPGAEFEVAITGQVFHRGWTITLTGRIDQLLSTQSSPLKRGVPNLSAEALAKEEGRGVSSDLSTKASATGEALAQEGRVVSADPSTAASTQEEASTPSALLLREIKTVTRPLPIDERELRADYPGYFAQLATYVALWRLAPPGRRPVRQSFSDGGSLGEGGSTLSPLRAELIFVEAGSGLAQTVALTPADDAVFRTQLDRIADFLDLRWRARERLRQLRFRPAFAEHRPGQETTRADLDRALNGHHGPILFEAPTGFGKTGMLLECALGQLQSGHFERVLYLTSKSTGQLQVVRTLSAMTAPKVCQLLVDTPSSRPTGGGSMDCQLIADTRPTSVAVWHVRNKSEHCINSVFHCVREQCAFLNGAEERWAQSGLARFYLFENEPRDLETLRAAGRAATICPYEITRAALAFNDVWIGDYNYVFAPRNRGLFHDQPGFDPARTLLILDEAHNLPSRVADAHSHAAQADDARALLGELDHVHASTGLVRAWESWVKLLAALIPVDALDPALEADVIETLTRIADQFAAAPPDSSALGPHFATLLWQVPELVDWLGNARLKKLLWCPRAGELHFTCFDAADAIGETLRDYGGVIFASATLSPVEEFAESCGLHPIGNPVGRGLRSAPGMTPISDAANTPRPAGTPLFRGEPESDSPLLERGVAQPVRRSLGEGGSAGVCRHVTAHTPWRAGAYDIAFDARVDTSFHQRAKHHAATAATVEALHAAAARKFQIPNSKFQTDQTHAVAVFFPSYAYAEAIQRTLDNAGSVLRVALQPRLRDLAAQAAWVEESLVLADALFLVLGSSFAESIDLLGGRVTHAMVVGPALPEVNAVQRARLAELSALGREEAFRRVYQIPGMTKVNQALGRLVRAPGQRARVILHCQRFLEPSYARLLAPDYQLGTNVLDDHGLADWLNSGFSGLSKT